MENNITMTSGCPDTNGTMPSCAPLAVPYVPFQQKTPKRYSQSEALDNGTLFPSLNLPFHRKVDAARVSNGALGDLQALEFVLLELGLYLDTHPEDTEAFILFQQYVALEKVGREKYEAAYGPLFQASTAAKDSFNCWIHDPWPWDFAEGGKA